MSAPDLLLSTWADVSPQDSVRRVEIALDARFPAQVVISLDTVIHD